MARMFSFLICPRPDNIDKGLILMFCGKCRSCLEYGRVLFRVTTTKNFKGETLESNESITAVIFPVYPAY